MAVSFLAEKGAIGRWTSKKQERFSFLTSVQMLPVIPL